MTRKACKRKQYTPSAPKLPLTDKHASELALQAHVAMNQIDSEAGLQSFIRVLTVLAVALDVDKRHDDYSRTMIRSGLHALDSVLKKGIITENQETLLKRLTVLVDEWCATRLTYRGFKIGKQSARGI